MAGHPRRVYAPALEPAQKGPPPRERRWAGIAFAIVVTVGSIAFIWSAWVGGSSPQVVKAPDQPFKVAAPKPETGPARQAEIYDVLETARESASKAAAKPAAPARDEAPATTGAQPDGPYFVQIAALKSFESAQALGPKLAAAHPASYKGVTFDVQRVERDGGAFFRVRAGYFADWAEASMFCNRLAALKQDCIVVPR
jgi:cell division septation protein DedD